MIHGDEWLRQEMRRTRKAVVKNMTKADLEAKIAEHKASIAGNIDKANKLNAELNDLGRDVARREGAVTQLRVLLSELAE